MSARQVRILDLYLRSYEKESLYPQRDLLGDASKIPAYRHPKVQNPLRRVAATRDESRKKRTVLFCRMEEGMARSERR